MLRFNGTQCASLATLFLYVAFLGEFSLFAFLGRELQTLRLHHFPPTGG